MKKHLGSIPGVCVSPKANVFMKIEEGFYPINLNYKDLKKEISVSNFGVEPEIGGGTTADVFGKILKKTPLKAKVQDQCNKYANKIILAFLDSKREKKDMLHLKNGLTAIVKRAYMEMGTENSCKQKTEDEKGHNLYWIRTGQTYKSLEGKLIPAKKTK